MEWINVIIYTDAFFPCFDTSDIHGMKRVYYGCIVCLAAGPSTCQMLHSGDVRRMGRTGKASWFSDMGALAHYAMMFVPSVLHCLLVTLLDFCCVTYF